MRLAMLCILASVLFSSAARAQAPAGVPVFEITQEDSSIKFSVKASAALEGMFDKWDTTLKFTSLDVTTGF